MKLFPSISFLGILTLFACNSVVNDNKTAADSLATNNDSVAAHVADTIAPDIEPVSLFKPLIKKIKKEYYYKASSKREVYTTAKYYIEWPTEAPGYDILPLQNILIETLFDDKYPNINTAMQKAGLSWFNTCGGDITWTEVKERGKTEDGEPSPDDDMYFWGEPEYNAEIHYKGVDNDHHFAVFDLDMYGYNGGGTGAGVITYNRTVYYLYNEQRLMTIDDIVDAKGKNVIIRKLNNHPIGIENYSCMNGTPISALSPVFHINKGIIYFTYPKYELACGADGPVTLGVRLSSIKDHLTEYGSTFLQ